MSHGFGGLRTGLRQGFLGRSQDALTFKCRAGRSLEWLTVSSISTKKDFAAYEARSYDCFVKLSAEYRHWHVAILSAGDNVADDPAKASANVLSAADSIGTSTLNEYEKTLLRFMCSSVVLNCAMDLEDAELTRRGRILAEEALAGTKPDEPLHFQCLYNVANATVAIPDYGLPKATSGTPWITQLIQNRLAGREDLRKSRALFFQIGSSDDADAQSRSSAYCNLANSLVRQPPFASWSGSTPC
jgi:hypothetical protein